MRKIIFTCFIAAIIAGFFVYIYSYKRKGTENPQPIHTDSDKTIMDQLASLGYHSWSEKKANVNKRGVTIYDKNKAFDGYNLFTDNEKYGYLMDMNGNIVHKWTFPFIRGVWEYFILQDDGNIVAYCLGLMVIKLDRDSRLVWARNLSVHHDIAVLNNGNYLLLEDMMRNYKGSNVLFDSILQIDPDGKLIEEWSTWEHMNDIAPLHKPHMLETEDGRNSTEKFLTGDPRKDYYHMNTIEVLWESELGKRDRRFQKGNLLCCLRNVNLVFILDRDTRNIVWSWGPDELDWPHMPTMLDNGHVLVFDNGAHRYYSRVIEVDPVTGTIVWEYKGNPSQAFYTRYRGSNQRLENGNTLICEADNGRVFEVTQDGEIVWEYYNPEIKDNKRKLIYRMERMQKDTVSSWLETGSYHQ